MKTIPNILCVLCVLCVSSSCSTTGGGSSVAQNASNFAQSAAGQRIATRLIDVAQSASEQYIASGNVDQQQLVAATLDGAAANLRGLVNTPAATSPQAIANAVALGANVPGISKQVPPVIVQNVEWLTDTGTSSDQAIENMATVMNAAAERSRGAKTTRSKSR